MTTLRMVALTALLSLMLGALAGPGPARADQDPAHSAVPTSVALGATHRVNEKGRPVKGQFLLDATLTTADGKPVNDRGVEFYEQVEFFGPRDAYLGASTTDSTGTAYFVYQPAETGRRTVIAYFAATTGYATSKANAVIEVTEVVPAFEPEPLPLATVRHWLPFGIGAIVAATWAVLLGVVLRTILGIRAVGEEPEVAEAVGRPAQVPVESSRH